MKRSNLLLGLLLLFLTAFVLASPPSGYHLLKKIPFGAARTNRILSHSLEKKSEAKLATCTQNYCV